MLTSFDQRYLEEEINEKKYRKSFAVIDVPETQQNLNKNQYGYVVPDNQLYRQNKLDQALEIAILYPKNFIPSNDQRSAKI